MYGSFNVLAAARTHLRSTFRLPQRFSRMLPAIRLDPKSFVIGAVLAGTLMGFSRPAGAIDFGAIARSVTNLVKIKKNLDGDVRSLTADAKTLLGDKDALLQIKDQLVRLATETRAQIDSVTAQVAVVEGHVKSTQTHITTTSVHVNEIDDVRKALEGK